MGAFVQESLANSQRYDCHWCQEHDFKDPGKPGNPVRKCFFDDPVQPIRLPLFPPAARDIAASGRPVQWEDDYVGVGQFLEILVDVSRVCPLRHAHAVTFGGAMDIYFGDVCPQSLLDEWTGVAVNLEQICQRYNCLLFPGEWYRQPEYIRDAFLTAASARNTYEKLMWKAKQATKTVTEPKHPGGANVARDAAQYWGRRTPAGGHRVGNVVVKP